MSLNSIFNFTAVKPTVVSPLNSPPSAALPTSAPGHESHDEFVGLKGNSFPASQTATGVVSTASPLPKQTNAEEVLVCNEKQSKVAWPHLVISGVVLLSTIGGIVALLTCLRATSNPAPSL